MTRINLLPWREARRKQQQRDFMSMLAGAAAVAFLGILFAHMQIAEYINYQESRNQFLRDEIERLQRIEQEIKELDKTKERLLGRLDIIQNLQRSRPGMVRVFDELVHHLPGNMHLESLDSNGKTLTLMGLAQTNNVVSDFMRKLETSEWFGEPVLKVVENKMLNETRASGFELTVKQTNQPTDTQSSGEEQ